MPKPSARLREQILDKALELAELSSWEQLHLHAVATALEITLNDIRQYYPQKDDLVEAWFDKADQTMLAKSGGDGTLGHPLEERLKQVITRWLDALAPHRRLTREMLAYKLEVGHVHLQALGILRISRTVQWFREAAGQDSTGLQRIVEECTLTSIYLATFSRWLFDDSDNQQNSKALLDTSLHRWQKMCCQTCCTTVDRESTAPQHSTGH